MNRTEFEVIIIGGGIAGVSLAYFLSERGVSDVALLEREAQHAYHSTGRSAATLVECDPLPAVQQLIVLGGKFLRSPPAAFAENPLLTRSQVLLLYRRAPVADFEATMTTLLRDGVEFESLSHAAAMAKVSALELNIGDRAILLTADGRIDVHELLSSYLRRARQGGADIRLQCEVQGLVVEGSRCRGVMTTGGRLSARWVVNAAGAWSGEIAKLAGAAPIRLEARRRTIVTFEPPAGLDVKNWPLVISDSDQIYFSPESTGLLMSPMDQTPTSACDAQPDDETIAAAIERLRMLAPALVPRTLRRRWAGLRTFSSDSIPVVGEDPHLRGFFWLAGQGGFGIESSPALGAIAADLLVAGKTQRVEASLLSPARFALS